MRALLKYYEDLDRPEASRGLIAALEAAWRTILANPASGLPAPRPYPSLASPGRKWIKSRRYWILYRTDAAPAIAGVFFETADIPNRMREP